MMNQQLIKILLLAVLLPSIGACRAETHAAEPAVKASGQGAHDTGKYPGKPQAAVDIHYQLLDELAVDQAVRVHIELVARQAADDLRLQVRGRRDQLELAGVSGPYVFGPQHSGQSNVIEISVTPRDIGLFYIHLNARLVDGPRSRTRSFAIPINTGADLKPQMKPAGKLERDERGEPIIVMPALEPGD